MKSLLGMLLLLLASGAALAQSVLRVVSESGAPLDEVVVLVDGTAVPVDADGRFGLPAAASDVVRVDVSAGGHYRFIHTLDRRDMALGAIAPIELVEKKPGRRLLLFAGDAMLTRRYLRPRANEPVLVRKDTARADADALLDEMRAYVELADFASVNLETTLADEAPGEPIAKSVRFYSPPALAAALEAAGFDYVALGNNHINDFQEGGVRSTLVALLETSLAFSGAGMNANESRRPAKVAVAGERYAFLSYVGWLGYFRPSQAAVGGRSGATFGTPEIFSEDLAALPEDTTSVLQYHSGLEYTELPALSVRTELRHAIDAGADVAVGHHPHVLQGYEIYRDRLIAYSIGNFLFDQFYPTTQLGVLSYVWMDGDRLHRAELVPLHVNGYKPTPATGSLRYATLHRIARLSAPFGTCLRESGMHAVLQRDTSCGVTDIVLPPAATPTPLRLLGVSPLRPVRVNSSGKLRLGTDILRRGDFEDVGRFGTDERGWLLNDGVTIAGSLRVRVAPGQGPVRTGMKMFQRTYTPSTPTTLSGRLRADGDARIRLLLQRQRLDRGIAEELANGPLIELAVIEAKGGDWQAFSVPFNQPRVSTKAVRLLIEVADVSDPARGTDVEFDDLSWVEWSTPWLQQHDEPVFATHVETRQGNLPGSVPTAERRVGPGSGRAP